MTRQPKAVPKNYKRVTMKGDPGEYQQVPGYIYCPQALVLGKLMTPLS